MCVCVCTHVHNHCSTHLLGGPGVDRILRGRDISGKQNMPVSCDRDQISVPHRKPTRKCTQVKPDPPVLRDNQEDSFRLPGAKACSLDHPNCISILAPYLANSFEDMSFTSCLLKKDEISSSAIFTVTALDFMI